MIGLKYYQSLWWSLLTPQGVLSNGGKARKKMHNMYTQSEPSSVNTIQLQTSLLMNQTHIPYFQADWRLCHMFIGLKVSF